jgi:hypothetical protein
LLGLAWGVSGCLLELPPATCQSDQDCFNGERCLDRRCVPDTAEGEGEGKEGEGEGAEGEGTEGEGEGAEGEGEGAEGEGEGAEGEGEGAEGEGEGGCPGECQPGAVRPCPLGPGEKGCPRAQKCGEDCRYPAACFPDPTEEICDGQDNDCDGSVDEDQPVGAGCLVQQGGCLLVGLHACQNGSETCAALDRSGTLEACADGRDDDCDGLVDEADCAPAAGLLHGRELLLGERGLPLSRAQGGRAEQLLELPCALAPPLAVTLGHWPVPPCNLGAEGEVERFGSLLDAATHGASLDGGAGDLLCTDGPFGPSSRGLLLADASSSLQAGPFAWPPGDAYEGTIWLFFRRGPEQGLTRAQLARLGNLAWIGLDPEQRLVTWVIGSEYKVLGARSLADTDWHGVVLSFRVQANGKADFFLYADGALETSGSVPASGLQVLPSRSPLVIGNEPGRAEETPFSGSVADPALLSRALEPLEVALLHRQRAAWSASLAHAAFPGPSWNDPTGDDGGQWLIGDPQEYRTIRSVPGLGLAGARLLPTDLAGRRPLSPREADELVGLWPLAGSLDGTSGPNLALAADLGCEREPLPESCPLPTAGPYYDMDWGALSFAGGTFATAELIDPAGGHVVPITPTAGAPLQLEGWVRPDPEFRSRTGTFAALVATRGDGDDVHLQLALQVVTAADGSYTPRAVLRHSTRLAAATEDALRCNQDADCGSSKDCYELVHLCVPRLLAEQVGDRVTVLAGGMFPAGTWHHVTAQLELTATPTGPTPTLRLLVNGLPAGESTLVAADAATLSDEQYSFSQLVVGSLPPPSEVAPVVADAPEAPFSGRLAGVAVHRVAQPFWSIARRTQPGPARIRLLLNTLADTVYYPRIWLVLGSPLPGVAEESALGLFHPAHPSRPTPLYWRADGLDRPFADLTFTGRTAKGWPGRPLVLPAAEGRGTGFGDGGVPLDLRAVASFPLFPAAEATRLTLELRTVGGLDGDLLSWGRPPDTAALAGFGLWVKPVDQARKLMLAHGNGQQTELEVLGQPLAGLLDGAGHVLGLTLEQARPGESTSYNFFVDGAPGSSLAEGPACAYPDDRTQLRLGEGVRGVSEDIEQGRFRWQEGGLVELRVRREVLPLEQQLPLRPLELRSGSLFHFGCPDFLGCP